MDGPGGNGPRLLISWSVGHRPAFLAQAAGRSGSPRRKRRMSDNTSLSEGEVALLAHEIYSGHESLPADRCLEIYRLMVRTRAMEERTIKMSKSGQGYFWIGGPGEEAFTVCL